MPSGTSSHRAPARYVRRIWTLLSTAPIPEGCQKSPVDSVSGNWFCMDQRHASGIPPGSGRLVIIVTGGIATLNP